MMINSRPDQLQPILLTGVSIRMLAELAVRAGYQVLALDYFGDVDLQALCPGKSLQHDYGQAYTAVALVNAAGDFVAPSVAYGASLENHPDQVARLGENRYLLGNSPQTLTQVRNPSRLATALQVKGFAFPQTYVFAIGAITLDMGRRWLWKPLQSGGGHSIRPWRGERLSGEGMLQERLSGLVGSVAFVADGQQAVLLGLTEQLVGQRVFGATGFQYCGNLLPPRLAPAELIKLLAELQLIVTHLTATFELRGLNGLDFIWKDRRVWTLEVNPRPPASLELIDMAYNVRVFDAHVQSFAGQLPDFNLEQVLLAGLSAGKAIIYATQDIMVGDTTDWLKQGLRDIPRSNEQIKNRHPICTIVTTGPTSAACLKQLEAQATNLRTRLGISS